MQDTDIKPYGEPHPNAPKELSQFSFLIGKWRGEGMFQKEDGTSNPYQMTWIGRYILDGYAIADEALIPADNGGWENIFTTYRFFNRDQNKWIIEVLNILESTLITQAPDELGGVQVSEKTVTLKTPGASFIGCETFLNISEDHFTYCLDISFDEGETWIEGVDVIEAYRITD